MPVASAYYYIDSIDSALPGSLLFAAAARGAGGHVNKKGAGSPTPWNVLVHACTGRCLIAASLPAAHSVLLPERFRIAPFPLRHQGQQPVDSPESRSICGMVPKGHLRVLLLRRALSLFPADFFSYACSLFSHALYLSAGGLICQ